MLIVQFVLSAIIQLFHPDGKPVAALKHMLIIEQLYDEDDTQSDILKKVQSRWIQVNQGQNNIERCDLIDSKDQLDRKEQLFFYARELGLLSKVDPTLSHYQAALVHGAMLPSVRIRIKHLIELWNQGIRFDKVYFLSGYRPLRLDNQESINILIDESLSPLPFKKLWVFSPPYETEPDMMQKLIEQCQFPKDFPPIELTITPKGINPRSSTKDNVIQWRVNFNEEPKAILAISSPLYVHFQHIVTLNVLGRDFPLETSAKEETGENLKVSVLLDTLAKIIYEVCSYS